ncbi:MAG: LpqN/LpqT family lipoprotein [Mycobacteriaceae bacterium]
MNRIARNWRVLVGGVAAGSVAVLGFTGASASAEPVQPVPPVPATAPATVTATQTVTVTPQATPQAATTATDAAAGTPAAAAATATPAAAAPADSPAVPLTPATSGTLTQFLKDKGVVMEPQKADGFTALNLVLPMPTGWRTIPDPNVPNAFAVIADRQGGDGLYSSNAALTVYKLIGDFDPREAISHGYVENQKLFAWQSTSASMADFGGFPSSIIEGTYRDTDMTLNTSRRNVIAQSGSDHYLVTLSVTTASNQAVATSGATDGIVNGFRITLPTTAPAPAAAAAAVAATAPAATAPTAAAAPATVPAVVPATAPAAVPAQ